MPNEVCSKCHEDFMNCKCEQFHPNITKDTPHFQISIHEYDHQQRTPGKAGQFLHYCIESFRQLYPNKFGDDIIVLWKNDFDKINGK